MRFRFDEGGMREETGEEEQSSTSASSRILFSEENMRTLGSDESRARVMEIMQKALDGALIPGRPLHAWEAQKLSARHIQMCLDRASGLMPAEISRKYRMHPVHVNAIMRHPFSRQVIASLLSLQADKSTDITSRLQGYANEMLDYKVQIVRNTEDEDLKNKIASDLLDRAGYGARRKFEVESLHKFAVPAAAASQLAQALSESKRVATIDYGAYTGGQTAQDMIAAASALGSGAQSGLGDLSNPSHDASLEASSETGAADAYDYATQAAKDEEAEWKRERRRIA